MSSETTTRKKRSSSETNPPSDGDHRKRRRNRTTQSCLNCHTSKRMCDRKRPACARCTQLGLTGLCVYEVDDPSQRPDSQDESMRLLKRVAELEGVIRELKNKPHPRWVQALSASNQKLAKWASRSQSKSDSGDSQDQSNSNAPSPPSSLSDKSDVASFRGSTKKSSLDHIYPPSLSLDTSNRSLSPSTATSSQGPSSPSLITPTDEIAQPNIAPLGSSDVPQDYDLTLMFLNYPELMGCDPLALPDTQGKDNLFQNRSTPGQCGCLREARCYHVVLELSLRLRRAAETLSRSASHHFGQPCPLYRRISELDAFATNVLGNIPIPPEDVPSSIACHSDISHSSMHIHPSQPFAHPCRSFPSPAVSSWQNLRSWDFMTSAAASPTSCDDSFMSWEPSKRA